MGHTESGQSRANQGIPHFACNPDLNHATETSGNQVLALNLQGLTPGTLLANIGSLNELAFVDPTTGNLTPFVTGLPGAHGLAFAASAAVVPEPASLAACRSEVASVFACLGQSCVAGWR